MLLCAPDEMTGSAADLQRIGRIGVLQRHVGVPVFVTIWSNYLFALGKRTQYGTFASAGERPERALLDIL